MRHLGDYRLFKVGVLRAITIRHLCYTRGEQGPILAYATAKQMSE